MSAQGLASRRTTVDLTVDPRQYFGKDPSEIANADAFGLVPEPSKDLYRVEYLYLLLFENEYADEYGGIQVRASTHLYLEDGRVPVQFQRTQQAIAHRGAQMFNTTKETGAYGGYLGGFAAWEYPEDYANWEVEPVGTENGRPAGATPGKIEWTTEVYLEAQGTKYADLSGVAQGIADPYSLGQKEVPPEPEIEAQQEWWEMTFNGAQSKYGAYDIHPPGRSASKERAKRLHGKEVKLNGVKIGEMTSDGRVYLAKKYADRFDGEFNGSYSRRYLVENTPATYQSIAEGRKIAKVDESPGAIYLETAALRDDSTFDPVDPDEIDVDREIKPGEPGGTVYVLSIDDGIGDPTTQEVRQDREVIRHLGLSSPVYRHTYADTWKFPGFRPIAEYGVIRTPQDELDEDQQTLSTFEYVEDGKEGEKL